MVQTNKMWQSTNTMFSSLVSATLTSWSLIQYGTAADPLEGQTHPSSPSQGMLPLNTAAPLHLHHHLATTTPLCYSLVVIRVYLVHSLLSLYLLRAVVTWRAHMTCSGHMTCSHHVMLLTQLVCSTHLVTQQIDEQRYTLSCRVGCVLVCVGGARALTLNFRLPHTTWERFGSK